ncbi:M23/M56 family metallopeptidase [Terricaulis sp.]|uniref:M23/M56 family metallopeptidase n=1 Tax=Terricaulis sp. TaxID=2768686 RepID=UPI002AC76C30|nr:M23/M56 family metallopeptidase [Terricaulis sp.]MDZ4692224.1 M23/M56 family metallopeptidase [Terricaulis sp.]
MSAAIAVLGALFFAPLIWSAVVALTRRGAVGWRAGETLHDKHEKAVLAVMLAPIAFGALLLALPGETFAVVVPPLLDFVEFAANTSEAGLAVSASSPPIDWLFFLSALLFVLYVAGVARFAAPLIAAHLRLRAWSASARPHPDLRDVYISDLAETPLAISKKRLLFPRALMETLSPTQVSLVVDHERHHHSRGDVVFYAALSWIEALLWFNPFVRTQTRNCRLAAELDCDAAVTAAAPELRRTYAQTLLLVLKHGAGRAVRCAPAVFSHKTVGEHRMRILQIMKSDAGARKRTPWLAYAAALALITPLGAAQLALAQSSGGGGDTFVAVAPSPISTSPVFNADAFTHRPVQGRVTGIYGARPDAFTGEMSFHPGVDIAAPMGAPVIAPANGRVIRVTTNSDYGKMIEIDHGDGFALRYAHLSAFDVRDGDSVQAGQVIGRVGNSGRSSGTHLHIEVWLNDRALDPRMVLDLPAEE